MNGTLSITGDEDADRLLNTDGTALLIGMMLDQQVPMEWAFRGPATLAGRLGHLDAGVISDMDVDEFVAVCREKPAIHRFPKSMGERAHALCRHLVEHHAGRGETIWEDDPDADTLFRRIADLPGYGKEKSQILMALLAKRFGVTPRGWEELAGPFADDQPRSAADIDGPAALEQVRQWKQAKKAAGKTKQD